jgi:CheY-like chemotaxis protein
LHGRVLLADDFADTRELIAEVLTSEGATVTAVDDGDAAVETAMTRSFDLILMDIRMPRMDGLTATAELRRRGCLTPNIALTASTSASDRQRILDAGFDDLWAKPMTWEHLVNEVAAYLRAVSYEGGGDGSRRDGSDPTVGNRRLEAARAEFIHNLPSRLVRITAAVEVEDMGQAREALHQLVGIGGMHGLMPISHEAARLLALAKSGALADRPDEMQTLKGLVARAVESSLQQNTSPSGPPSSL